MPTDRLPGMGEVPALSEDALPKRIGTMHRRYGSTRWQQCGTCVHFVEHRPGQNIYHKCDLTVITSGPGTDWRSRWPACGRWGQR